MGPSGHAYDGGAAGVIMKVSQCPRALDWKESRSVAVPYLDNLEPTSVDGLTCLIEVERIYRFDWDRFDELHWEALARTYENLPGASGGSDALCWFGDDENVPPFLLAMQEPAGLRVRGVLPEADWWAWDQRFRDEAAGLPSRGR